MTRLPLAIALAAAAILGPSLATSATAADGRGYGSDNGGYQYGPFTGQEDDGQGYARAPDGAQGEDDGDGDAAGRDDEGPAAGSDDGTDDGPAEPDDAQRYSHDEDADADAPEGRDRDGYGEDRYERAAPPRAEVPSPADDFEGSLPRVEVRAAAPDGRVPAEVREQDARRAAIEAWRAKVTERYGGDFAHWRMAEGKRVECAGEGRNGVACTASAVPMYGFGRYGEWQRRGRY